MKLYYSPGACSLSPHIVLHETGATFDLERVDLGTKKTASGADFTKINPKGYVPALELDDGEVLTEGVAIVQFLADQRPQAGLAPSNGTRERVRLQEQLNFVASEVHKSFAPLFNPAASDEVKNAARANVARRLDHCERILADGRAYLMGDQFSVADAYLFTIANWAKPNSIDLSKWPKLSAYVQRTAGRKAVQAAMQAEGLLGAN
jgi:glutathione S-transferase